MSNTGDCRSGLKVPAPGAVNVPDNSPIMFLFYLEDFYDNDKDVFDKCNIWIGGLQVIRAGDTTKGWELIERSFVGDKAIFKIRYRGSLPPVQMFCYGEVAGVKFCDHFFVKGQSTSAGIILKKNQVLDSGFGFMSDMLQSLETKHASDGICSIVRGDIFWGKDYFCTLSRSISPHEINGLKCHKHKDSIYFFCHSSILIIKKDAFRRIVVDPGYLISVSSERIDLIYKKSSKTMHIYKNKDLEPIDRSGDIFDCDVPESCSIMSDDKVSLIKNGSKVVYDKNFIIIQRSFDPLRSNSDDILWTKSDISGERNLKIIKVIESVSFADCDKLLVKMTGGDKFLVGIHVPDVERI